MKKLFKWTAAALGVLVLLLVAAGVALLLIVDKEMVAERMETFLHRQVIIEDIQVSLFSVVSGIEVKGVRISNARSPRQMEALRGKPVPDSDLFASLKSLTLKLRLLPLLSGRAELRALTVEEPVVNVVRYRGGAYNFSDLMAPEPSPPRGAARPPSGAAPAPSPDRPAPPETRGPVTADILPVRLTVGKVGVENGTIRYTDRTVGETFQVSRLTLLAHDADIDPGALESRNLVKVRFEADVRPVGTMKSAAVETFDVSLAAHGWVKPFDAKTRRLDPEVSLEVGSPRGTLTGLRILETLQTVKALEPFTGKLSFLRDSVRWNDASLEAWYQAKTVKLSSGRIPTADYVLRVDGSLNVGTQAMDLKLGMELGEAQRRAVRSAVLDNVGRQLTGDVARYLPPEKVTDLVMQRLETEPGRIVLTYQVTGTPKEPKPRLVSPALPSLQALVREAAGDAAGLAAEAARQEAGKALQKATGDLKKQLEKSLDFRF